MSDQPLDMRACADRGEIVAGRYYLKSYLNEGNFGAVYRANHYAYGMVLREVAIKIAKRPMKDAEARRVFGDALVMATVQESAPRELRDRFVTVHDAGTCAEGVLAGHPYIVMELVEGGSLAGSLKASGRFPLDRAVATFDQILEAMACVHGGRFVHRDLKPSNILVTRHREGPDTVKVTDFGLAQHVDTLLGWTDSGGDLAHLAPESFDLDLCSPQSDVYMLGLIFYEMLTGSNPFADVGGGSKGRELQDRHMRARKAEKFAWLEKHEQIGRHPALAAVIRRALSPDMNSRYDSPTELKVAWDQAKNPNGPPPPPPTPPPPWVVVRRKLEAAESAGLPGDGEPLLEEAMKLNRDQRLVPKGQVVGKAYLRQVEMLLHNGRRDEAGILANEGRGKRECTSTLRALAKWYANEENERMKCTLETAAENCPDKD